MSEQTNEPVANETKDVAAETVATEAEKPVEENEKEKVEGGEEKQVFERLCPLVDRSVFLSNIDDSVKEEDLKPFFEKCGEILAIVFPSFPNGTPKGHAFVQFKRHEDAAKCVEKYKFVTIKGKLCHARLAKESIKITDKGFEPRNSRGPYSRDDPRLPPPIPQHSRYSRYDRMNSYDYDYMYEEERRRRIEAYERERDRARYEYEMELRRRDAYERELQLRRLQQLQPIITTTTATDLATQQYYQLAAAAAAATATTAGVYGTVPQQQQQTQQQQTQQTVVQTGAFPQSAITYVPLVFR